MPVSGFAGIGSQRLGGAAERVAIGIEILQQRRRKALGIRAARLAGNDQRNDPGAAPQALEHTDLFVHMGALRGIARTQHDEELRIGERRPDRLAQAAAAGKLLAVTKDRSQGLGNGTDRAAASDQPGIDAPVFQLHVDAAREPVIAVAVGEECTVGLGHRGNRSQSARHRGCHRTRVKARGALCHPLLGHCQEFQ